MAEITGGGKIRYDFKQLDLFARSVSGDHVVKVGIFGNKTARTGKSKTKTNAELGALHEFGSFSLGIPARSFLRWPLFFRQRFIIKEASAGATKLMFNGQWILVLKRLGIACERAVLQAFASRGFGSWAPNAPSTIARKGSDAPLIDTGQLRRAIASKVEKR